MKKEHLPGAQVFHIFFPRTENSWSQEETLISCLSRILALVRVKQEQGKTWNITLGLLKNEDGHSINLDCQTSSSLLQEGWLRLCQHAGELYPLFTLPVLIDLLLFDFWSIFQVNSSFYCLCAKLRYSDRKIYATNGTLLCLGSKYARYDFWHFI